MVLIKMSSISDPCRLQLSSCVIYYWPWFYIKCPLISDPRQLRLCSNFVKKPDSGRGVPVVHAKGYWIWLNFASLVTTLTLKSAQS